MPDGCVSLSVWSLRAADSPPTSPGLRLRCGSIASARGARGSGRGARGRARRRPARPSARRMARRVDRTHDGAVTQVALAAAVAVIGARGRCGENMCSTAVNKAPYGTARPEDRRTARARAEREPSPIGSPFRSRSDFARRRRRRRSEMAGPQPRIAAGDSGAAPGVISAGRCGSTRASTSGRSACMESRSHSSPSRLGEPRTARLPTGSATRRSPAANHRSTTRRR